MIPTLRLHPDRIVVAIAGLAWATMLAQAAGAHRLSCCPPHPSHAVDSASWFVMVAGMMLPTTAPAVRDVAARSYRTRRLRSVFEYILGYLAGWLPLGMLFILSRIWQWAYDLRTALALCLLAAVWALLPTRALWFSRCHRQIPLSPTGLRADYDAFRQGIVQAVPCSKMCWPLMLACAVTGHDLALMTGGALIALAEKRAFRPNPRLLLLSSLPLTAWLFLKLANT